LTSVASAPAGTPVIIKATEGEYILTSEASPADVSENKLQAATTKITADGTQYILANGGNGIGFYPATNDSKISAGKAYLSSSTGARSFSFVYEGETTGISSMQIAEKAMQKECYDLQGRKVVQPTKGLYIMNGKKMIIQ